MATGKDKRRKRRRKTYAPDNPIQSKKFIEAARELGVDTNGKTFAEVFRALVRHTRGGS